MTTTLVFIFIIGAIINLIITILFNNIHERSVFKVDNKTDIILLYAIHMLLWFILIFIELPVLIKYWKSKYVIEKI